uniref:HTH psq-type domain-containing protein n=1 Tax=Anguilla anguilla TaxID=7936 RepID=A0A0E9UV23_ANGAN
MRTKSVSMPVKEAIVRLINLNELIRNTTKTLGVSKSTVWYIVRKQECAGNLIANNLI